MELTDISKYKKDYKILDESFKVISKENKTFSTGTKATVYNLEDENGMQIEAKIWNRFEEEDYHILKIEEGYVNAFRGKLEISINKSTGERLDDMEPAEEVRENYQLIREFIDLIEDRDYRDITSYLYEKYEEELLSIPAGYKMHHNYRGGLLEHIREVTSISYNFTRSFPDLNQSLLMAGALLHDIGKVKTLKISGFMPEMDIEAHMFDHLYLGTEMVKEAARELSLDLSERKLNLLINIIGSHHNRLEYGAIFRPATMEAYLVYISDLSSTRYNMYQKEYLANGEPDIFTMYLDDGKTSMYGRKAIDSIMEDRDL